MNHINQKSLHKERQYFSIKPKRWWDLIGWYKCKKYERVANVIFNQMGWPEMVKEEIKKRLIYGEGVERVKWPT